MTAQSTRFDYQLPGSASSPLLGLTADSYEVHIALVYDMILPESRTPLQCIVNAEQVSWSTGSDPVLVPVDVSGNTVLQRIRTVVSRFALTSCPSGVHLLYVHELQTALWKNSNKVRPSPFACPLIRPRERRSWRMRLILLRVEAPLHRACGGMRDYECGHQTVFSMFMFTLALKMVRAPMSSARLRGSAPLP